MYIPKTNAWEDINEILAFLDRFSFGMIISRHDNRLTATHIPMIHNNQAENLVVQGHLAFANTQWKDWDGQEVLLIFTEPHAYISPKHYEKMESVPTWNYMAVHLYGQVEILRDPQDIDELMKRTMLTYEKSYYEQWLSLSADFKARMLKGIVPFQIRITDVQAKAKLSQNKKTEEIAAITKSLKNSTYPGESLLAAYMENMPSKS